MNEVPLQVEKEVMTWNMLGQASRDLAQSIVASNFKADMILAIARGGLLPAGALSYDLELKNVLVINVEFYTGVDQRLKMPVVLPPVPQAVDLRDMTVLIVDDVADTGGTLQVVRELCFNHVKETRCAVLYQKPRSIVQCEYSWRSTDQWIEFPWSKNPSLAGTRTADS